MIPYCHRFTKIGLYEKNSPCLLPAAAAGHTFATRMANVFVIGRGDKPLISLPKGKGVRLNILEEAAKREAAAA